MQNQIELIERLIETDDVISEYIDTQGYLANRDSGSVNLKTIINDCFIILTNILEDNGIVFHVTGGISELLEDYYNASHLILLYREFTINGLIDKMTSDPVQFKRIRDIALGDTNDNELLIEIMRLYSDSSDVAGAIVFLEDKVASTDLYGSVLRMQIDALENTPNDTVSTNSLLSMLDAVMIEKKIFTRIASRLTEVIISGCIIDAYRKDILDHESFSAIASFYAKGDMVSCRELVDEIKSEHPDYMEHRKANDTLKDVTYVEMVVNICLTLSNERLFEMVSDFTDLISVREDAPSLIRLITTWYQEALHENN